MTAATCPWCGSQTGVVPWARQHAPSCPHYQPDHDEPVDVAAVLAVHSNPTRY